MYGTTEQGGDFGNGTVFSLEIAPKLDMVLSGTNAILTWPTNFIEFNLQSTTNLASLAWSPVSPGPTVVNGQNVVTNPVSSTRKFYWLSQ